MLENKKFSPIISLTVKDQELANNIANRNTQPDKVKQVYYNTLAVLAVKKLVDWLEFPTDLEASDSWNHLIRSFNDVADLEISNLGKLECRPVFFGETEIVLPPEVSEERIGYVGVQFYNQQNQAELLGFLPARNMTVDKIKLADLQPINNLGDYLDKLESSMVRIKLTDDAYQLAKAWQPNSTLKPAQITDVIKQRIEANYYNNLAIWAVNYYCQEMDIETDLEYSKTKNLEAKSGNVALLDLPGLGGLECRSILLGETKCLIPSEVWEDRIGYMIVEINDEDKEAILRGFYPISYPVVIKESIDLHELLSIEEFLDYVERLNLVWEFLDNPVMQELMENLEHDVDLIDSNVIKQSITDLGKVWAANGLGISEEKLVSMVAGMLWSIEPELAQLVYECCQGKVATKNRVNLSQWFQNIFDIGWNLATDFLAPQQLRPAHFAIAIERTKLINLGADQTVVLLVNLTKDEDNVIVNIKVYPYQASCLPANLQLDVVAESEILDQIIAGEADQYIQYELAGESGDEFEVKLRLGEVEAIEEFVI